MANEELPGQLTSKAQGHAALEIRKSLGVGLATASIFLHRPARFSFLPRNRPAVGRFSAKARPCPAVTREESDRLVGKAIAARGKAASPQSIA